MTKKKVKYPFRKFGKETLYDEYEDGSIKISPIYSDLMNGVFIGKMAIEQMLKFITQYAQNLLLPLIKEEVAFWNKVRVDYSLNPDRYDYTYDWGTGIIHRKEKKEDVE